MIRPEPAHILMVYPPLAAPSAPSLQMAWLARQSVIRGLPIKQYDANIDFFVRYLFSPENLNRFLTEIEAKKSCGAYRAVDPTAHAVLKDLSENRRQWEKRIASVGQYMSICWDDRFYRPDNCVLSLGNTKALLKMISLAFYPSQVRWDTFDHPMAGDPNWPLSFAQDASSNPFIDFFKVNLYPKLGVPGLHLLLFWISSIAQLPAAATMAVFSKKTNPGLPVAVVGAQGLLSGCERFADSLLVASDDKLISRLKRLVVGKYTDRVEAGTDFSHALGGPYLSPALALSFDLRPGGIQPNSTTGLLEFIDTGLEQLGNPGLLITVDGDLQRHFYEGPTTSIKSVTSGLGIKTKLREASRNIDGQALRQAGVSLIVWQAPRGSLEALKAVLWQMSRAGIWNHLRVPQGKRDALTEELYRFSIANPNIVHSWDYTRSAGSTGDSSNGVSGATAYGRVQKLPGKPLWQILNDPAHLLLYLKRHGRQQVLRWWVPDNHAGVYTLGSKLEYHYKKPGNLPLGYLHEICLMVEAGGSVNMERVRYNLERAFLIAYVMEAGMIVGNYSLKNPRREYIETVNQQSGLDLTHYVERGYASVRPEYRGMGIGASLLAGLMKRAGDRKVFSIIGQDNEAAQKMATRNRTRQVAEYYSQRLGKRVGVWIPEKMLD